MIPLHWNAHRIFRAISPTIQSILLLFGAYAVGNLLDDLSQAGVFAGVLLTLLPAAGYASLAKPTRSWKARFGIALLVMLVGGTLLRLLGWN